MLSVATSNGTRFVTLNGVQFCEGRGLVFNQKDGAAAYFGLFLPITVKMIEPPLSKTALSVLYSPDSVTQVPAGRNVFAEYCKRPDACGVG